MAAIVSKEFGMKKIGQAVQIPNNPKARLMYYLHCVSALLELDNPDLDRLTNYKKHHLLTLEETKTLLALVLVLSPDELIDKVFYPNDEGIVEFYEISQVEHMLAALTESVIIGGKQTQVKKIMLITMDWIQKNYLNPILELPDQVERENARAIEENARRRMLTSRVDNARDKLEHDNARRQIALAERLNERERQENERSRSELAQARQELEEARKEIARSRSELAQARETDSNKCCVIL